MPPSWVLQRDLDKATDQELAELIAQLVFLISERHVWDDENDRYAHERRLMLAFAEREMRGDQLRFS